MLPELFPKWIIASRLAAFSLAVSAVLTVASSSVGASESALFLVRLHNGKRESTTIPLSASVPHGLAAKLPAEMVLVRAGGETIPVQRAPGGDTGQFWFVAPRLAPFESVEFRALPAPARPARAECRITPSGPEILLREGGESRLFTRYAAGAPGANKPYFYPILSPTGDHITRRWPIEPTPGESNDHPHHRGMWFTHGSVNGADYWAEPPAPNVGRTVTRRVRDAQSGAVFAGFTAETDWIDPAGALAATDTRTVRVFPLGAGGRILDFDVTLRAAQSLVFGDTKEGSFGLRVSDALAPARGAARIVNAEGLVNGAAWGKPSEWAEVSGTLAGHPQSVAIFPDPRTSASPSIWHVREYGLFAANPFGRKEFGLPAQGPLRIPQGADRRFHYQVYFRSGSGPETAALFAGLSDPPTVTVSVPGGKTR